MALCDAILATLLDGEASGYDLTKKFDASTANFWTSTPQQLYRELEKMEANGLISATLVEQEKRPNKKVFRVTDAGRAALRAGNARTPRPTAIRDELLVQVQSMEAGDIEPVLQAIREKKRAAEAKLERYERRRERILDGRSEAEFLATADRIGPYLALARGMFFETENIRWCGFVLDATARRAALRAR
ncbi:PadR family transcriptional regulator [Skermania piniformis]|uniref:PadR family transcriptional regulator n=1 Tax=Skermania pinensis TaxID=39122 RepID=A0ABX8S8B1_9ACTN|nr:PadR family transcriptional regulator [Skermania piniformis]QXQ14047.1 PadR family transcriptional regulator [Skermania piniformis]